jgi:hypothetical protein
MGQASVGLGCNHDLCVVLSAGCKSTVAVEHLLGEGHLGHGKPARRLQMWRKSVDRDPIFFRQLNISIS